MSSTSEPKYELIFEACKQEPDSVLLETYGHEINNWLEVLDTAYVHGVLPLVYKAVKNLSLPPDALQLFKAENLKIAQSNIQMSSELVRIAKLLDAYGISYMALKGPVLSNLIHGDAIQRQYTDLDILIEKNTIKSVGKLLYEEGYASEHPVSFLENKTLLDIGKDFTFRHEKSGIFLEVHWNLFIDRFIKNSSMNLFTPNALSSEINGYTVKTLDLEYLLVYLCLHGSQHFWERISWVVDIDRLLRRHPECDWDKVQCIIQDVKIASKFYLGLAVVKQMFNPDLPEEIERKLIPLSRARDQVFRFQFSREKETMNPKYRKRRVIHNKTLITDSRFDAFRNYTHMLFRIKEEDIYMMNLPYVLSPLYYLLRQARLIRVFFTSLGKNQ